MHLLHIILELLFLNFEAKAINASRLNYYIVCFNARIGWIPFKEFFKPESNDVKLRRKEFSKRKARSVKTMKKYALGRYDSESCLDLDKYSEEYFIEFENNISNIYL